MGDDGLHVDEVGPWSHWLGRVAHKVARSAQRFRGRTVLARRGRDDRGGLVPSDRNGSRMYPEFPVHSVKDLIAVAKRKPGTIDYASAGIGTSNHLTVELPKVMAGIDLVHVPFRDDVLSTAAVLAGQRP